MYDKHEANVRKARERSIRNNQPKHKSPSKIRRLERRRLEREAAASGSKVIQHTAATLPVSLEGLTKTDLMEMAKAANIKGRSKMDKAALVAALRAES